MDPNAVVLEISSDEEISWSDCGRGILDLGDDHKWLAELLDEVNKESYGQDDGGVDADEVVLVEEVSPAETTRKKSELKSSLVDLDDDCVILDHDPEKPVEVRHDNPTTGNDDSDDLVVVSEKGQIACRDYPHPRHLCIKFPFSATLSHSHCNQCYCYVCDSLAPCVYWGNGSLTTDHCHATDKDESWRLERKIAKKQVEPALRFISLDPVRPSPPSVQTLVPGSNRARYPPANFEASNITNQTQTPVFASRHKFHPDLVSQLLLRTNRARAHRNHKVHNFNLATQLHCPVFKSPGAAAVAPTVSRHSQDSYRGSFVNPLVDQPLPFQPQLLNHSTPNMQINSNPYLKNQILHQPQVVSCQPSYPVPCPQSYPVLPQTQVDSPSVPVSSHTQIFSDPALMPSSTSNQFAIPANEPPLAVAASSGLSAEYQFDNWIFDNQPVEPGFMDVPGPYDSAFIDTGPIFDF